MEHINIHTTPPLQDVADATLVDSRSDHLPWPFHSGLADLPDAAEVSFYVQDDDGGKAEAQPKRGL